MPKEKLIPVRLPTTDDLVHKTQITDENAQDVSREFSAISSSCPLSKEWMLQQRIARGIRRKGARHTHPET